MWQRQGAPVGGWRADAFGTGTWQGASQHQRPPVESDPATAAGPLGATAVASTGRRSRRTRDAVPGPPSPARGAWEPTPIFQAVASEWERHRRDDVVADRPGAEAGPAGDHGALAASSADTGPLPVQRTHGARAHDLAPVHAVPPPPPHDARRHEVDGLPPRVASAGGTDRPGWMPVPRPGTGPLPVQPRYASWRDLAPVDAVPPPPPRGGSLEDELIRRAERRRRPLSSTPVAGGRHALRPLDGDEPTPHADPDRLGTGGNLLTFTGIS